jgi:uncharacterized protein (DUF2147 family)
MSMTLLAKLRLGRSLATLAPALLAGALACAAPFSADAQQPAKKKGAQAAVPAPAVAAGPEGVWIDHTGRGAVEIAPCPVFAAAAAGSPPPPLDPAVRQNLCGRIVWLQNPNDAQGRPLVDALNKNAAKRGAPICGLQIIGEAKPQADGSWDKGWIYDPEQGSSFDVELRLRNPETLQVKGYMGMKFLSETFVWRRAKEPPPKCGA